MAFKYVFQSSYCPRTDRKTDENLRERVVGMLESGTSTADLAVRIGSSEQTVRGLRRRFTQTRTIDELPRSGRLLVTTRAKDRYIMTQQYGTDR